MLVFYEPIHFGVTTDQTFQWTTYQTSCPNNMSFVDSRLSLSTVNFGRAPRQRSAVNLTKVQRSAESAFVPEPLSGLPCNWLPVINNIKWKIYVVILTKNVECEMQMCRVERSGGFFSVTLWPHIFLYIGWWVVTNLNIETMIKQHVINHFDHHVSRVASI